MARKTAQPDQAVMTSEEPALYGVLPYTDDTEVRPSGGRINNANRQIKLRTVPGKKIKRIADGT